MGCIFVFKINLSVLYIPYRRDTHKNFHVFIFTLVEDTLNESNYAPFSGLLYQLECGPLTNLPFGNSITLGKKDTHGSSSPTDPWVKIN